MLQGRPRELVKRLLELSRAKLVFKRITQTRYTRFYFFLSAFSCLLLCALQAVILSDNTKAVEILTAAVDEAEPPAHITILKDGELHVCDSIPDRRDSNCIVLWLSNSGAANGPLSVQRRSRKRRSRIRRQAPPVEEEESDSEDDGEVSSDDGGVSSDDEGGESSDEGEDEEEDDEEEDKAAPGTGGTVAAPTATSSSTAPTGTVTSSTTASGSTSVTISSPSGASATIVTPAPTSTGVPNPNSPLNGISLNQNTNSPHSMRCIYSMSWLEETLHDSQREDAATLFFHVWLFGLSLVAILNESLPHLGAAFAGHIMAAAWSSSRIMGAQSLAKLYRDIIIAGPCEGADLLGSWWEMRFAHTIPIVAFNIISVFGLGFLSYKLLKVYSAASFYKIVLVFSVGLQLSGFFTAVSSGLWLSKVAHGNFKALSRHEALYIAGFVVILVAELPWLILGWVSARKECKKRFWGFAVLSAVFLSISGVMFGSEAYRTIFKSWRFFATVTVTAFILLVLTVTLGFVCYFNYGKGLQAYLQMSEEPEGADFDPVGGYKAGEKFPEEKPFPASFYGYAPAFHEKSDAEWSAPQVLPKPPTAAEVSQYLSRTAPARSWMLVLTQG
ncbi:hypothetical protein NMY22_g18184 [Coprinellus aureogranulatus]|nr:hypothetical protein NMY22_g18184 [Coprinellus aureogranulatus]